WDELKRDIAGSKQHKSALKSIGDLSPLHFPVAFPEVFVRDPGGFDVVLGNPPWDKIRFEAQQFWVTRSPGLNSLPPAERERLIEELRLERPTDAQQETAECELRE